MPDVKMLHVPAQLVVFRVGPTRYGLDIDAVEEILAAQPVTPLAGAPGGVLGLIDVRTRVVPVFDLHWKFAVPRNESERSARMILVDTDDGLVALLVDGVDEVVTLPRDAFQRVSAPGNVSGLSYLSGVVRHDDELVLWVDHRPLVPSGIARAAAA